MARRISVVKTAIVERNYGCERCGAFGVVSLRAVGQSGWRREGWWNRGDAEASAREDAGWALQHDADRIMAMMRCPTCRERAPRADLWSAVRMLPGAVIGAVAAMILTSTVVLLLHLPLWLLFLYPLVLAAGVWFGIGDERRRRREARNAIVTGLVKGQARLPTAVARPAPKRLPPAPAPKLEPLRTTAPEEVERASDDEGPRFLRGG